VEKRATFVQIIQINQLVVGQIIVEASLEEVVDLYLEVAVAARTGMEKEARILGS
jgi:hypothetical protein